MIAVEAGKHKPKANINHDLFSTEDLNLLYFIERNLEENKDKMNKKLLVLDGDLLEQIFEMITQLGK